jgi:hypothetical protein
MEDPMKVNGWTLDIDVRVLLALHEVPDAEPIEKVAEYAGVSMRDLRNSMTRLGCREPATVFS